MKGMADHISSELERAVTLSELEGLLEKNLLALQAVELEAKALTEQRQHIHDRIEAATATRDLEEATDEMPAVEMLPLQSQPLTMACSTCSRTGKDNFSNAQKKRPALTRRCKLCIASSSNLEDGSQGLGSITGSNVPSKASSDLESTEQSLGSRPGSRASARTIAVDAATDPRQLAAWSGGVGAVRCFEEAISSNARNVLASHREMIVEMPSWIQFCVSVSCLVGCFEAHVPLVRFVLRVGADDLWRTPEMVAAGDLIIDVLDTLRVASRPLAEAAGHDGSASACVPLLLVRYMHVPAAGQQGLQACRNAYLATRRCPHLKATVRAKQASSQEPSSGSSTGCNGKHASDSTASPPRSASGNGEDSTTARAARSTTVDAATPADGADQWARTLRAQGEEEIQVALAELSRNAEALATSFRADFLKSSRYHDHGATLFGCSFLVPPVPQQRPKSIRL